MKWKFDENGKIVIGPKGNALRVAEDGTEYEFDAVATRKKLGDTMTESKNRKIELRDLKAKYDSIPESIRENPQAAVEAVVTVSSMGDKHKTDMEKIKADLKQSYDSDVKVQTDRVVELEGQLFGEKVTTKFATTKSLDDTIFKNTRGVAESYFKSHFSVDDKGSVSGKHSDGSTIYSKENPGEPAKFDECITTIINSHPDKDSFMAASGQKGENNQSGDGSGHQTTGGSLGKISAGLAARKAA